MAAAGHTRPQFSRLGGDQSSGSTDEEEGFSHGAFDDAHAKQLCCGVTCLGVLILFFALSFKGVHATEIALKQNTVNGVVDTTQVFKGRRYFLWPWQTFITWPATLINLEWLDTVPSNPGGRDLTPMDMRTSEGNMVRLSLTMQYRINPDTLHQTYVKYKLAVEQNFVTKLRAQFADYISKQKSESLWEDRPRIAKGLLDECHKVAQGASTDMLQGFVECWQLQFCGVNVQQTVEDKFTQLQVQNQKQQYELRSQVAQRTRAATKVIESEFDRNISIVRSAAQAEAYQLKQKATSDAQLQWAKARASALGTIQNTVTTNSGAKMDSAQLIKYVEKVSMIDSQKSAMTYGDFNQAVVFANSEL